MKSSLIALCLIVLSASVALAEEFVGQRWENSLLTHKRNGTLAGPGPLRNACGPRRSTAAYGTRPADGTSISRTSTRRPARSAAGGEEVFEQAGGGGSPMPP